jgi:hypothetical protein
VQELRLSHLGPGSRFARLRQGFGGLVLAHSAVVAIAKTATLRLAGMTDWGLGEGGSGRGLSRTAMVEGPALHKVCDVPPE